MVVGLESWTLARPEIFLAAATLLLLIYGVVKGEASTPFVSVATSVVLLATAVLLFTPYREGTAFASLFIVDRLTVTMKAMVLVGAAVAVAGSIGFIGLVAPHLVRRWVGSDPARVCLPAALMGAALLTAADIAVRLIPANPNATAIELKLGVVTALIGVPFFLAMIFRERRLLEGSPQ